MKLVLTNFDTNTTNALRQIVDEINDIEENKINQKIKASMPNILNIIMNNINDVLGVGSKKAFNPTAGDIAILDGVGNVTDSGIVFSTDGTMAQNSINNSPVESAIVQYVQTVLTATNNLGIVNRSPTTNTTVPDGWCFTVLSYFTIGVNNVLTIGIGSTMYIQGV